jgi:hypothetical protein
VTEKVAREASPAPEALAHASSLHTTGAPVLHVPEFTYRTVS